MVAALSSRRGRGLLRQAFFLLLVRPFLALVIGLNVRHPERLPRSGPALVVANHNSHLDVLVLLSLFPLRLLPRLQPVAAADYFLRNRWLAWFSTRLIGIVPIERGGGTAHRDPLAPVEAALAEGAIVILFPEGTRGEPEVLGPLRSGVAHLLQRHPQLAATPVFLHGLGKALPRGEALLVPFFCDVVVGDAHRWCGDRRRCLAELERELTALAAELDRPEWN